LSQDCGKPISFHRHSPILARAKIESTLSARLQMAQKKPKVGSSQERDHTLPNEAHH